ncbi:hypothetical protein SprV_0301330700 [Sparganum proliferum]
MAVRLSVPSLVAAAPVPTSPTHNPGPPTNINRHTVDTNDVDSVDTCPHCDRTFTSHIGLLSDLRIHRTEAGEPVPGAPTYARRSRLHCPHSPRTFTHRMGLFGHMRIHESGIDVGLDTASTSRTATMPSSTHAPSPSASTISSSTTDTISETDAPNLSYPHTPRTFASRIGLIGHLRIYHTETGEPVSGHPHILAASASTASKHTHIHPPYGIIIPRKPAVDNRRLHHTNTTSPTNTCITQHLHPPPASNCHFPLSWEVCVSAPSPCGSFVACVTRI